VLWYCWCTVQAWRLCLQMFRTTKCSSSDLYVQFYGISFMHPFKQSGRWQDVFLIKHILPSTRLLIRMHERNIIKLHVQVFLMMKTWMFETWRRHYNFNWIINKTNSAFCCYLLHIKMLRNDSNKWELLQEEIKEQVKYRCACFRSVRSPCLLSKNLRNIQNCRLILTVLLYGR
jgi:hypothetical protein